MSGVPGRKTLISRYSEFVTYSPRHDSEMARLSMWDEQRSEHWLLVKPYGKGWADRRRVCTFVLLDHIERGEPAGEVKCPDDGEMHEMVLELQGIRAAKEAA